MTTRDDVTRRRVEHAKACVAEVAARAELEHARRVRFATAQRVNGPYPLTVVLADGTAVMLMEETVSNGDCYTAHQYQIGQAVSE